VSAHRTAEAGCEILDDGGTCSLRDRTEAIDVGGIAVLVGRNDDVAGAKNSAKVGGSEIDAAGTVVHRDHLASGEARGLYDCGAGVGGDDDAASIEGRRERE